MIKKVQILKKAAFVCWVLSLFTDYTTAQYYRKENYNWKFNPYLGLDFNTSPPTLTTSSVSAYAGTATSAVSNSKGELLFYTDGEKVWDRNGNVMPNGDLLPLFGASGLDETTYSADQGALIVPFPGDTNKYYVFSQTYAFFFLMFSGACYYSVVDMALNNGLGDVVAGTQVTLLEPFVWGAQADKLIAVPGDDCNIWLLRAQMDIAKYKAYEINASGLNTTPVQSVSSKDVGKFGGMAISPNRKKLATANANDNNTGDVAKEALVLSDFDPATGMVSNSVYLDSTFGYRGVCFSPDNSKLYASAWQQGSPLQPKAGLYQFDLTAADPSATKTLIVSGRKLEMQLAPDGRIYLASDSSGFGVIKIPNAAGLACGYSVEYYSDTLNKGARGFQNTVMFVLKDSVNTFLDTLICDGWDEGVYISAHPADTAYHYNYVWNTGDTGSTLVVNVPDTYIVTYSDYCFQYTDTFILRSSDLFATITTNGFELGVTGGPYVSYQWYLEGNAITGAIGSIYTVNANGNYTVKVTDENGCAYTTDSYTVTNWGTAIDNLLIAGAIHVYPNPSAGILHVKSPVDIDIAIMSIEGKLIAEITNAVTVDMSYLPKGIYLLQISDSLGAKIKVEKIIKQ